MPNFNSVNQLDLSDKVVVVAGGTQGIGAAIARLCARLGATTAIVGRNATLGVQVVEQLRSNGKGAEHAFISGDFASVKGTKQVAKDLKEWAGERKISYLFMTQGGPPPAVPWLSEDGVDGSFAIQVLSRFVLATTLVQSGTLATDATVVSIAGAGQGSDKVDLDNLDSKGLAMFVQMANGGDVIDCYTKELTLRYPPLRAVHLFPGFVRTNLFSNSKSVWYIRIPINLIYSLPFLTRSADQYAPIALWVAASEEAKANKDALDYGEKGTPVKLSLAAQDDALRVKVWEKLGAMAEGKK